MVHNPKPLTFLPFVYQDVKFVSRGDVAEAIRSTPPDPFQQGDNAQLIRKDFKVDRRFHLAYILTLGVAENFRGIGLGEIRIQYFNL